MPKAIEQLLHSQHLRVTKPRTVIFRILQQSERPLSIVEIATQAKDIDKVSVYRTIELFAAHGIASTVAHGWKQRYELAAPLRPHHHHISCVKCGALQDVHHEKIEHLMEKIASQHGYKMTQHTFEISGLCQQCNIH